MPAGPLTHADMQALFSPVPFGEPAHESYIQRAAELPFWDTFRSIDLEKQKKILQASQDTQGTSSSAVTSLQENGTRWPGTELVASIGRVLCHSKLQLHQLANIVITCCRWL